MKMKCFRIILKTKEEDKIFSFRSKLLPDIDEELVLYYNGANRFVKVKAVLTGHFPQVLVSEVEANESS
jgi:hypothetical protein